MNTIDTVKNTISEHLEAKPLSSDIGNWYYCLNSIPKNAYVPLQYKPEFLLYQSEYFKNVYADYQDISMVLYRGGHPVGIWPICAYTKNNKLCFGTAGAALMEPLLPMLPKAEAQRAVIENCLNALFLVSEDVESEELVCSETVLENGASQWMRKLMEHGAKQTEIKWQAFVDLSLDQKEIQARMRRTNKYSFAKGQDTYDISVYDKKTEDIDRIFDEFHTMHRTVAGRETRSQSTWDVQKQIVQNSSSKTGNSFLIFIRDKDTKALAGSALFDSTPQTGLYCVAAYDRTRFSKPVGHIVQAVAMERMRTLGVRWYEIGERIYPSNAEANKKLVDIGHYKEGFATHFFPRVFVSLDAKTFKEYKP